MLEKNSYGNYIRPKKLKRNIFVRQDCPKVFSMNTVAYVVNPNFILKKNNMFEGNIGTCEIEERFSLDLDTLYEVNLLKKLVKMNNILKRIIVKNQNCIITGATGNLGKSISFILAEMGFDLILTDKSLNQLKNLKKEINKNYKCKVHIKVCDLSKETSRINLIKYVNKNFKKLDLLINNAALTGKKEFSNFNKKNSLKDQSLKDWQSHIEKLI